jgi:hypothetical protein
MEPKSGEETAEEDESCYEESSSVSDEDDDDDDEEILMSRRSLLFLCQEGQIRIARQRLQSLKHANKMDRLKKEIFQVGRDKNYSLHEILMGGTSDTNAFAMTEEILDMGKSWKGPFLTMMNAQPPSHHRTSLHWAAWGNATLPILRALVMANPEALVLRDGTSQGRRTPLEVFRRYFGSDVADRPFAREKLEFLDSATKKWTRYRLRLAIYKSAVLYFRKQGLTPFDQKDRKANKIKPRPWFCLSTLGDLLQREMQLLVLQILEFVGRDAKVQSTVKKRKRNGGSS